MKNLLVILMMGCWLPLLSGCAEHHLYVVESGPVVTEAPPAPQTEIYSPSPGSDYVWIPGYWSWHGHWVWVSGHWGQRPHEGAVWVEGNWKHHHHGYLWTPGHWQ